MTPEPREAVRLTHAFTASAERVFDVWLCPDKIARWLVAGAVEQVSRVDIDARVGGSIHFVAHRADRSVEYTGEYLEIQRPRRLCFTIRDSASGDKVRVSVQIEPRGAGCFLSLVSKIEPAPLHAIAPMVPLAAYRAERMVRPRWPRVEAKAALSVGLHLAMLPLLLIVLRTPEVPPPAEPPPMPAMVTVELGTAQGSAPPSAVAPGEPRLLAPPVAPIPTQPPLPAPRPARHAATSRKTLSVAPSHGTQPPNRTASSQAASVASPGVQPLNASGAPPYSTLAGGAAGENEGMLRLRARAASAQGQTLLAGTTCSGTISFSPEGGFVQSRGGTGGLYFYGGQKVPVEVRFFEDGGGKPWIRFTFWAEAPWDLPVRIAGDEIRWTDLDGSGYALRPAANGHLTGLAGFSKDSAAEVDFTCVGSDGHHT